jgi:hypothetical protein
LFAGATKRTTIDPLAIVGAPIVGAFGTVAGTTAFDAALAAPVPTLFVARTVHVYDAPFVSAPTAIGLVAAEPLPATPPVDDAHDAA